MENGASVDSPLPYLVAPSGELVRLPTLTMDAGLGQSQALSFDFFVAEEKEYEWETVTLYKNDAQVSNTLYLLLKSVGKKTFNRFLSSNYLLNRLPSSVTRMVLTALIVSTKNSYRHSKLVYCTRRSLSHRGNTGNRVIHMRLDNRLLRNFVQRLRFGLLLRVQD